MPPSTKAVPIAPWDGRRTASRQASQQAASPPVASALPGPPQPCEGSGDAPVATGRHRASRPQPEPCPTVPAGARAPVAHAPQRKASPKPPKTSANASAHDRCASQSPSALPPNRGVPRRGYGPCDCAQPAAPLPCLKVHIPHHHGSLHLVAPDLVVVDSEQVEASAGRGTRHLENAAPSRA